MATSNRSSPGELCFCQLLEEFCLPFFHLYADRVEIHFSVRNFRKKFFFFLFDVMLDLFAQHLHFRIEQILAGLHSFDFGNEILGPRVLDNGFVEQIVILCGLTRLRIKDFLLDLHVHRECHADLFRELAFGRIVYKFPVFLEKTLHLAVVLFEKLDRI